MVTHLEKAQAALDDAAEMGVQLDEAIPTRFFRLIDLAMVQAQVATAEAMTRIADHLDAEVGGSPILQSIAWNLDRMDAER